MHQFKPLRDQLIGETGDAGHVSAGSVEAGDEAFFDGVLAEGEDDRDRRGRRFCGNGSGSPCREDHIDFSRDQFDRKRRQEVELSRRKAEFEHHVLALDKRYP